MKVPAEKKEGEEAAPEEIVGLIVRNPGELVSLSANEQKSGALIVVLNDLESHPTMAEDAAGTGERDRSVVEVKTMQ